MSRRGGISLAGILLASTMIASPQAALAKGSSATEMEARLQQLEAQMQQLRAELAEARQAQAQTEAAAQQARQTSEQTAARVAVVENKTTVLAAAPKAEAPKAEGMQVGSTTVKLGGFIKLAANSTRYSDGEPANNSLGRDFYLPQTIPVGGAPSSRVTDFSAKQTRLWMNLATDIAGHSVKAYVETDFQTSTGTQGTQRTTNGYNLALRRAYMQVDRWTFGQDWSTFQYPGALPESTDFVGATEGTVFVRQPLIRYSAPLSKQLTLHISAENPEAATANAGTPALIENGDDHMPDFAARFAYTIPQAELSLAALGRQVRISNGGIVAKTSGWAISGAGKIFLNSDKTSDIRFMTTYGHNAGRYVGINFAPDAVYNPITLELERVNELAVLGALRVGLAKNIRANVMGSFQKVDYSDALTAAQILGMNKTAWSVAGNIFYSPVKNVDLGIEYRHGFREVEGGDKGTLDRVEFAAKYNF
ncbi:MAG: DcaP family trimeric outer membrane transporter [Sphingomonadaceae bacterium]